MKVQRLEEEGRGRSGVNKHHGWLLLVSQLAGQDMPRSHPRRSLTGGNPPSLISIISLCCCALNIYQSQEFVSVQPPNAKIAAFVCFQFAFQPDPAPTSCRYVNQPIPRHKAMPEIPGLLFSATPGCWRLSRQPVSVLWPWAKPRAAFKELVSSPADRIPHFPLINKFMQFARRLRIADSAAMFISHMKYDVLQPPALSVCRPLCSPGIPCGASHTPP